MRLVFRGIGIVLLSYACSTALAQSYPRWFLFPDELPCGNSTVGMAQAPYYPDSTGGEAFLNAAENAVRSREVMIEGTKEYGATDAGVMAISTTVREVFDSASIDGFAKTLRVFDIRSIGDMTIALAGSGDCSFPDSLKTLKRPSRRAPSWIATLPQDSLYFYALGMSEPVYYEFSAWLEAEKHARLELAKSIRATVHGIDRLESAASGDQGYSTVQDEEISVTLRHVQVLRRWKDVKTQIYAVLIRMPR